LQLVAPDCEIINAESAAEALASMSTAEGFFGKLTPDLLAASRQLRWVQSPTASLEHFLFPDLIAHPCLLSNMRGLFSDVVADHVMGFVLSFARNLYLYRDQQQARQWSPVGGETARTSFAVGPGEESEIDRQHRHLADCTLGVFGVGSIGSEVCRRASGFGMRLLGVDPQAKSVPGVLDDVWPVSQLPELLSHSDFVVVAAPHTPRTEGLFGATQFAQMRREAFFINIGRGAIARLADLTAALQAGTIAGAALDVFETEPLPAEHPLWRMPNVILTPHVAAASTRVPQRHLQLLVENVRRFAAGETPLNLVDKASWF
ncbi:MAG: D-2-hydroxyacid dehydrogenase, partial [Planctomycetaceae bacterium]